MTRINFLFLFIIFPLLTAKGQTKSLFPEMTEILIDTLSSTIKTKFYYDKKTTKLINKPCYSKFVNRPLPCDDIQNSNRLIIVGKFKNELIKDSLTIVYSTGFGNSDPKFGICTENEELILGFRALNFCINSNGIIYTTGHINNTFNKRQKFQIINDTTVLEVKQPYNYVGLKGKLRRDITLFKERTGDEIVEVVLTGNEVEILLTESSEKETRADKFLVKTSIGLIGWLILKDEEDFYGNILKDLYFAGAN